MTPNPNSVKTGEHRPKKGVKPVKAWAIISIRDSRFVSACDTGYWIFDSRKDAQKELDNWFFPTDEYRIKLVLIIPQTRPKASVVSNGQNGKNILGLKKIKR